MVELDGFAEELFAVLPEAKSAWRLRGASHQPDHDVPTLWLSDVGHAIADVLTGVDRERGQEALDVVERHLASGTDPWKDALATGLLEALASDVSGGRLNATTLAPLLGPASRAYFDAWDEFTLGRSSLE